jgi:hypothetical protein
MILPVVSYGYKPLSDILGQYVKLTGGIQKELQLKVNFNL